MSCGITTLVEFRDYIKRELGAPVLCPEISDDQIDQQICNAVDWYTRYAYGEGVYQDYLGFCVSAGVSAYDLSTIYDGNITDTIDFNLDRGQFFTQRFFGAENSVPGGVVGTGNAFYPSHGFLYSYSGNGYGTQGYYGGGGGGSGPNGATGGGVYNGGDSALGGYYAYASSVDMWKEMFQRRYRVDYSPAQKVIRFAPTPTKTEIGLLTVYVKEKAELLYCNILVRKLATAYAMKQWGLHLLKYSLTLPGGGTVNGSEIFQNGLAMEQDIVERIEREAEPPDFFIG